MDDLSIDKRLSVPASELSLSFARSGGPGGQHVNTTDTRVRLRFDLLSTACLPPALKQRLLEALQSRLTSDGVLVITSDRYRSRHRNIEDVRERLRSLILEHRQPPKKRRPTKPTRGSQRRRLDGKKRRGEVKAGRKKPRMD